MYTFLKALDEKRSNPWYSRCQSFTEKKIGLKGTSSLTAIICRNRKSGSEILPGIDKS